MTYLDLKVVTLTLSGFAILSYALCVIFRPVFPGWAMYNPTLWQAIFPGFRWTVGGVLLGLVESIAYALYTALVLGWLYNFFARRVVSE